MAAFRQGLNESGFNEGQNVTVELRFADNQIDRLPGLVDELVRRPVNVIVTNVLGAVAAKNAATAVPIVFVTGSDPVKDGLVASLNRPGGNITGVSFVSGALATKRFEILRQLTPNAKTIAMLVQLDADEAVLEQRGVQAAARATGQQLSSLMLTTQRTSKTPSQRWPRAASARFTLAPARLQRHIANS